MRQVVIFGNSGSGKSTLAKELSAENLAHLDLDSVAWRPLSSSESAPERKPIAESRRAIDVFTNANESWVIEGCYADLLEIAVAKATEIIFLNLPVEACISNAKSRPWELHKYASKEAQDENLEMLVGWIAQYAERDDVFSKSAHERLFQCYQGKKTMVTSNEWRK